MYVEINSRGSGKTTRLVEDAVSYLLENKNKTVLLVTPKASSRKEIKNKIFDKCGYDCLNRTITSSKMLPSGATTLKQYVDEFLSVYSDDLVVDDNAYYTSSLLGDTHPEGKYKQIIDRFNENIGKFVQTKPIKRHGLN